MRSGLAYPLMIVNCKSIFMKKGTLFLVMLNLLFFACEGQVITRFAGNGTMGFSGDGGPANIAQEYGQIVRCDGRGNFFLADRGSHRIRKINSSGIITTVAGNGSGIHSGDGGPATAAGLVNAISMAIDRRGNMYIAEDSIFGPQLIRKVDVGGIITIFAGGGTVHGDGGPATAALLLKLADVQVDTVGNVYIADLGGYIRKVDTFGIITTVMGNGAHSWTGDGGPATAATIGEPFGIAIDHLGDIFISDGYYYNIRKITPAGIITNFAGNGTSGFTGDGGPATAAEMSPVGISVDRLGNIYFSDPSLARVRKISTAGIVSTIAGNGNFIDSGDGGQATAAAFYQPWGTAVDTSGNVYVCSMFSVRKISMAALESVSPIAPNDKARIDISTNPSLGIFTATIVASVAVEARLFITDANGKILKEIGVRTNEEIPLHLDVPSGIYIVSAIVNGTRLSEKLVFE